MLSLNKGIPLVVLQFRFSNARLIPRDASLQKATDRSQKEGRYKKPTGKGTLEISPTDNCSIAEILTDLQSAGYELVDVFYEERVDPKQKDDEYAYYYIARFTFARRENDTATEEAKEQRSMFQAWFRDMSQQAFWRTQVFLNPFYKDGKPVPGQHAISVNMTGRNPRFYPNGNWIKAWKNDGEGNHIGDRPVPIKPNAKLFVEEGVLKVKEV